jgi:putative 4-mercaptohistidine N1-methyltranferase
MTEMVAIPWDWPVEVNYHEAKAFCNWKANQTGLSVRLPTEDEWLRIYDFSGVEELTATQAPANIHNDYAASSCPVNYFPHGDLYDVIGNVWQWTETPIYPLEGFEVHPLYDDFTMPTFDGRHNLFKGGSWISNGNESRKAARYAFRKHFFQHAGFRYVVADKLEEQPVSNYENDKMLSEYAEFHYGDTYYDVANFPEKLANIAIKALGDKPAGKALDIGCAVGRSSFELAKHFNHVTGIDFSARLINLGVQLATQGVIRYSIADEGELMLHRERRLSDLGLASVADKVEFLQGDACNLMPHFTGYDVVIAANLIDRLYDPALFLSTIHQRMNVGGVLLIASPYTWLEEHTKKENWVGGFKKDGENFTTLDGLKSVLGDHFDLMQAPQQVPFVIRETSRKFQHTLSDVTLWVKR